MPGKTRRGHVAEDLHGSRVQDQDARPRQTAGRPRPSPGPGGPGLHVGGRGLRDRDAAARLVTLSSLPGNPRDSQV